MLCEKLERFARGEFKKLMVFMPPQHGKSQLTTRHLPAFLLGIRPSAKISVCCYSATLAQSFNRDIQRIIDDIPYHDIFPGTYLSASNVTTDAHGSYLRNADIFETIGYRGFVKTVGVGGSLTGTPIDIGIIDDPFKDREEAMSIRIRDKVWSWFTDVFRTRLHNDSQELVIMCMVGDTRVLMANGSDKSLRELQIGDSICTYDEGTLTHTKVVNWKKEGIDFVYEIRMRSGIIVKANKRHPFLKTHKGNTKWERLQNLKPGDEILRVMQNGERIKARDVPIMVATNPQRVRDIATPIIKKHDGHQGTDLHHQPLNQDEQPVLSGGMALAWGNSILFLKSKMAGVRYAVSCLLRSIPGRIGMVSYALTTATRQGRSEDYCAMTATLPSDTVGHTKSFSRLQNTCDFIPDIIEEIVPIGREEVFDIQVERTENFIANGLVSHNTRWDEDDLAGRILKQESDWEVITLQAIKERDIPGDPRAIGEALWPARHSLDRILSIKETSPFTFSSLYQQEPKPSSEALVFPEWDEYEEEPPYTPVYGLDFGFTNDPTAIPQVKIHNQDMWLREKLYRKGLTTPELSDAIKLLLPYGARMGADSADPRTIEDLKRRGHNVIPAIKGPDSIISGINWLKSFRIHVHKDSHNLKNELLNYQWVMYGGKATNMPIDSHNHLIDGARYTKDLHKKNTGLKVSFPKR